MASTSEQRAKAHIRRWQQNPIAFVREVFHDEPDAWQAKVLAALPTSPRIAMQACKGPGKSRLLAWIIWWFLVCFANCNIAAISITAANLASNLWKELALLRSKSLLLQQAFEQTSERIFERKHKLTWFCEARSFPQSADPAEQKQTIAGLHNPDVMVVLDEAGDMPPGLLAAAEAIFMNEVNAHLVMAGNPTSMVGALYEACVRRKHRYLVVPITGDPADPNRSPRISISEAQALIDDYGRDNPYVMVNVLGLFPPVAADKLLGQADIDLAKNRNARPQQFEQEPMVWGLDIARHGDDASVLYKRQGVMAWMPRVWRTPDLSLLADQVAMEIAEETTKRRGPQAVFIGVTGMGWGCYDRLDKLGLSSICIAVDEASGALQPRFLNRRAEMWWNLHLWVKRHGCIPEGDVELHADLIEPSYEYRASGRQTKFQIESNDDIKKRLGRSPDHGTALALTHAAPVAPPALHAALIAANEVQRRDFDAWAHLSGGR